MSDKVARQPIPCTDLTTLLAYEGGRRDAYEATLASSRNMTREMLIKWLESEIAQF